VIDFSNLIAACEEVWRRIQVINPDVPNVVVNVGSGGRRAQTLYGHFAPKTWEVDGEEVHEVLIVAEQLHRGPEDIFTTLLHEAAHGVANTRGIKDVSGKRHNKKYANIAEEMGLEPPTKPDSRLGYSDCKLTEYAAEAYQNEIALIEEQLKFLRKLKLVEKETKKTTWVAECDCQRKIRLPKKTIEHPDELNIVCHMCGESFRLTEEDRDIYAEMFEGV
jgi:hypothetical protein